MADGAKSPEIVIDMQKVVTRFGSVEMSGDKMVLR